MFRIALSLSAHFTTVEKIVNFPVRSTQERKKKKSERKNIIVARSQTHQERTCNHLFCPLISEPYRLPFSSFLCFRHPNFRTQSIITKDLDNLPINYALLQLVTSSSSNENNVEPEILPYIEQSLTVEELQCYKLAKACVEELALYLKPNGSIAGLFSRPMQRKLVTLINCQLVEEEGRARSMRAARSLGERTVTELILQHQNPQQLSANLWAAVRARGCQFLGPAMQEEVLKLVLVALDDGHSLCRKVLVMFVVQKLETQYPQASKTSIGHVVQLLYRASCFKVTKRDGNSSLMQLKEEFRSYKNLRKEHDAQIVQIATEAGLRIAPDQWSALLYGDPNHKSDMQSLIDKQQSPQSFGQSVQELMIALQRTGDPANLSALRGHLKNLAAIDASSESNVVATYQQCADAVDAVKHVVNGLVEFVQHHGSRKSQDAGHLSHTARYKISFCRDLSIRGNCPRGSNCTFAHSDEELERYRAKMKKTAARQNIKDPSSYSVNSGPNPKVNITHSSYANNNAERFNKSMPFRSETSLHHTSAKTSQHLMPTYPSSSSSSSTPNLSQSQLSPKLMNAQQAVQMNNRFNNNSYNYPNNYNMTQSPPPKVGYNHQNFRPPPLSAPPVGAQHFMKTSPSGYSPEYKKQYSPYHSQMPSMNHSPSAMMKQPGNGGYFQLPPPMGRSEDYSNNNDVGKYSTNWRSGIGNGNSDKIKSPNNLIPKSPLSQSGGDSNHTSPMNRSGNETSPIGPMYRNAPSDEVDGIANMWMKQPPVFQFDTQQVAKDNFTRSDSILTSGTDDDFSFDNMSLTGKYGPIGIKKSPPMDSRARQWGGLQSATTPKRFDNFNGSGAGDPMKSFNNTRMMNTNGSNGSRQQKGPHSFINLPMSGADMNVSVVECSFGKSSENIF